MKGYIKSISKPAVATAVTDRVAIPMIKLKSEFDEAQIQSLIKLSADIIKRHPDIKIDRNHIIGHDEIVCTKSDPGPAFPWEKVISEISKI